MSTLYCIASVADLPSLYERFEIPVTIGFPTVFAREGERITGILATQEREDSVIAGPFEAETPLTALRLLEMYEAILRGLGISAYWFHVEHSNAEWLETVRRSQNAVQIDEDAEGIWFKRTLRMVH